jgi:hypothetical protein
MVEKTTIRVGMSSKVETWRDGEWVILYVEDGSGAKTTVSLTTPAALELATLLCGMAISAAFAPCDCGAETEGKWADKHTRGCASLATSRL